ncbi:PQQ-binding-like beta-propeller repeat protein [Enterobacteriaceae endosymbiont of Donacia semicuprea]|uniref:outer membrane protein assembly factor BamB family protein n=1 Tax=Enterobacteriaceae endosymbiont of Donacia semicuprea TaxID=2675783 RepID=UPI001449F18C|nr:PQQ-binding-like beta-propeller repeat protein [Enterobacteriaceae endosymbiont of Donacia semicuprea]QJC32733.1 PQQ-binding-like beta-propeller repeat protein [Enterobacteriaceae endosymbiont of Donacia semicuprea]
MKLSKFIILIFIFSTFSFISCTYKKNHIFNKTNFKISQLNLIQLKLIWKKKIENNNINYTKLYPVYKNNLLYIANKNGTIYCISMQTGKIIWHVNLIKNFCIFSYCKYNDFTSGPIISNNYLYLGNKKGQIIALNIKNKSIIWKTNVFNEILSSFIIKKDILLVHNIDDILQGLNKKNGKILWTVSLGRPNKLSIKGVSTPVIFFDNVITGGDNGIISSRIITNGSLVWEQNLFKFNDQNNFLNINDIDIKPVIYNGNIYVSSYNGNFIALDLSTGKIIWKKIYFTYKNFIIYKNIIYLIDSKNRIIALDANNGNLIWIQNRFKKNKIDNLFFYKKNIFFTNNKGFIYWINYKSGNFIGNKKIDKYKIRFIFLIKNKLIIQTIYNKIYLYKIKTI